jgi:post-segregation antitoxin (ccd killing protein)
MNVDRLSVTVPSEIGGALRKLAKARGANVSTIVTEAIARELRLAALDVALAEDETRFGPVPESAVARAEADLAGAPQVRVRRRRRRAR